MITIDGVVTPTKVINFDIDVSTQVGIVVAASNGLIHYLTDDSNW